MVITLRYEKGPESIIWGVPLARFYTFSPRRGANGTYSNYRLSDYGKNGGSHWQVCSRRSPGHGGVDPTDTLPNRSLNAHYPRYTAHPAIYIHISSRKNGSYIAIIIFQTSISPRQVNDPPILILNSNQLSMHLNTL
jgi:hypothetical protein